VSSILTAEMWYDHEPILDRAKLLGAVRKRYPDATVASTDPAVPFLLAFPSLVHRFADGTAASLLVSVLNPTPRDPGRPPPDLTQTWSWPDAERTFAAHTHTLLVADLMGRVHPAGPRVAAFQSVVEAILELTQPNCCSSWCGTSSKAPKSRTATPCED